MFFLTSTIIYFLACFFYIPTARFNADIVSLIAAGEEADAGAVRERVQTTLDDLQLTGG